MEFIKNKMKKKAIIISIKGTKLSKFERIVSRKTKEHEVWQENLIKSAPGTGFTEETGFGISTLQFRSPVEMKASPSRYNPAAKASGKTAVCKKTRRHKAEPEQAKENPG